MENEKFKYPSDYDTMSVEKAFEFLELARDGHGFIFSPDNYNGFLSTLVLKCGVDIDYVFGSNFVEKEEEVKKHLVTNTISTNELEKEVQKRIQVRESKSKHNESVTYAKDRYNELTKMRKVLQNLKGNNPSKNNFFEGKSVEEIDELYQVNSARKK